MKGAMVPLQESKRIVSIDILRGLAIFRDFFSEYAFFPLPALVHRWCRAVGRRMGWDFVQIK
ncbi:hypothetical protein RCO48_01630 [Peribacillus frigoritolerans]|nr:hypothetical protein [Peribacillus frigoritolerans]